MAEIIVVRPRLPRVARARHTVTTPVQSGHCLGKIACHVASGPSRRLPASLCDSDHRIIRKIGQSGTRSSRSIDDRRLGRKDSQRSFVCLPWSLRLHVPGASRPYFLVFGRIVSLRRVCGSLPARTDAESEGAMLGN